MMYLAFKVVHILAVVAFIGNISTGLFWKRIADQRGDATIIAHTISGIIASDRLITIPSILILVAAGVTMALLAGTPILGTGWILWGIVLLSLSGVFFIPLSRAGAALLELAQTGMHAADERERYRRLSSVWELWGALATIAPLIAAAIMIVKPALPAL